MQNAYFIYKRWYAHSYVRELFIAGRLYHRSYTSIIWLTLKTTVYLFSVICMWRRTCNANLSAAVSACMCIVPYSKCNSHHGVAGCL